MKRQIFKWLSCVVLIVGLIIAALFTYNVNTLLTKPMLAPGSQPVLLQIKPNSSATSFVKQLYELKLIHSKKLLLSLMHAEGYTNRIKAGIYQIEPGETAQQLLDKVIHGKVLVEAFTIIEGTTLKQVVNNLKNAPYLSFNETDLVPIAGQYRSAEGLLLADTYNYDAGENAKSLLQTAHKSLINYLDQAWAGRSPTLPYQSSYQLLIAASIIEKETAIASERKLIAGVISNRLKRNMPLQMDPTVIYALGEQYKGQLSHEDMRFKSPFNTYINRGLPPTPIAMVDKEAIDAAAHPQPSNYLYFVAKGDGSHQFSETYSQQKKAILHYKYHQKEF